VDVREVSARTDAIVVGAFNFSESRALAELYAEALRRTGEPAEVLDEVASREIMEPALEQGQVDFVPEYLGTALTFLEGDEAAGGSVRSAHAALVEAFAGRGVHVAAPAPGQNRNEIVVTRAFAREHSLATISDLARIDQDSSFGGPAECLARPLCMIGLEEVYGLSFDAFESLDAGGPATVAALAGGEVQVALLFTTNPQIGIKRFVVLEDDRSLQPPENVVPVLRDERAARLSPAAVAAVDAVTQRLTDAALRRLNGSVEIGGLTPADAAAAWLDHEGILAEDA
jgi:osmoprotectant transport system substrate-binding protein